MKKELDPRDVAKGMLHKFSDPFSQEYLDKQRKQSGHGLAIQFGKRFCASCHLSKPKGNRKAVKGWVCDDCKLKRKAGKLTDPA